MKRTRKAAKVSESLERQLNAYAFAAGAAGVSILAPDGKLPDWVDKQLTSYALAASAAGVSLLALTVPASAKIIYTADHRVIGLTDRVNLDLNHDGKTDVTIFESRRSTTESGQITHLLASAAASNRIKAYRYFTSIRSGLNFASAVRKGQPIGGSQTRFGYGGRNTMAWANTSPGGGQTGGAWGNIVLLPYRYLGIQFQIDGKTHYGWARLIVKCSGVDITATLTGYAYETVPNKRIIAGQKSGPDDGAETRNASAQAKPHPPTLGWLAQGAAGLGGWRQKGSAPTLEGGE